MKQSAFYEPQHDKADTVEFFASADGHTPPHFHRCIEMLYVTAGAIDCRVNGEPFCARRDHIIFVHKCGVHELTPAPRYKDYVLIIGPRYSDDFSGIFQTETLPALLADEKFNRTLLPHFRALEGSESAPELVKKGYIDVIVGSLLSHYRRVPVAATPNIGIIVNALNYIDDHFREPLDLETLSRVFGYNKYYFSRLFNSYIGETLNSYINMVRIRNLVNEAKKRDNPNLSELVFANGFDSMTTFYRSFSKYYDHAPTQVFKDLR